MIHIFWQDRHAPFLGYDMYYWAAEIIAILKCVLQTIFEDIVSSDRLRTKDCTEALIRVGKSLCEHSYNRGSRSGCGIAKDEDLTV